MLKAAVLGHPINHSLSPSLHTYWLNQYKINGTYTRVDVPSEHLETTLRGLHANGFSGVNLTIPHKESALKIVDHMDALSQRIGAINTVIVHKDGSLEGRNTDAYGFTQNLLSVDFKPDPLRPVTLLGAGGAARSALMALLDMGLTDIRLVNRTLARAEQLAAEFSSTKIRPFPWLETRQAIENTKLLINSTSLGLKNQPFLDIDLSLLPKDALVTDMVYMPLITPFLQSASMRGNKILDGLGMLLHQARPAFAAFFGKDPEVTLRLKQHLLDSLAPIPL